MEFLVFGSLNIDRTYRVPHFVRPGETMAAESLSLYCGGKGFNQAIALARAGARVSFAGAVGSDGQMLEQALRDENIDTRHLLHFPSPSGHAVIQVAPDGQNCIMITSGTNGMITPAHVDEVLSHYAPGTAVVLQNEISSMDHILATAHRLGLITVLNPSPCDEQARRYNLSQVDFLLVNEGEGQLLTDGCMDPQEILQTLHKRYPGLSVVLTLGGDGSLFMDSAGTVFSGGIYPVRAVDTTAAGDTFTGFFLKTWFESEDAGKALRAAAVASGLSVSRDGAAPSIPRCKEVEEVLQSWT